MGIDLEAGAMTPPRPQDNTARSAIEVLPTLALRLPSLPPGIREVEVRRSQRRRSTVSARTEADRIIVLLPAHLSANEEQDWVNRMVERLAARRSRPGRSDADLAARAEQVASRHLDLIAGRQLRPTSVQWVTTMNKRWASCSTDSGAIRVSHRLRQMPDWVLDYVLAHELAHLVESNHGRRFRELLAAYPLAERAEGYLQGWANAQGPTTSPGCSPGQAGAVDEDDSCAGHGEGGWSGPSD